MDKFIQKVSNLEKTLIKQEVLTEANTDYYELLKLLLVPTDTKYRVQQYDPQNVYYLDGGSKSLSDLYKKLNVERNARAIETELSHSNIDNDIALAQDVVKAASDSFRKVSDKPKDKNYNTLKANYTKANSKLEQLNKQKDEMLNPFGVRGELKTTKPTGELLLSVLLYNAFNEAITTQRQNYIRLSELLEGELRARAKYTVKLDLRTTHKNMEVAHKSLMNFINKYVNKTTNMRPVTIRYMTKEEADKYQKEGGFVKRMFTKGVGAVKNYLNQPVTAQ